MAIGGKDIFYITTFNGENMTFNRVKIKYENNIEEFYNTLIGANDEVIIFAKIKKKGTKKNAVVAIKLDNNLNVSTSKVLYESEKNIEGEKLTVSPGQKYFAILTSDSRTIYDFEFLKISEDKSLCNPFVKPCLTDDGALYYVAAKNESLFLCSQNNAKENKTSELKVEEGIIDVFIKHNPATGNIHLIESFGESESKVKAYLGNTKNKNFLKSIRHIVFDKDMNAGKQEDIAIKSDIINSIGNEKNKGIEWMSPDNIYFFNNKPILMLSKKYSERIVSEGKQDQYFSNIKDLLLIDLGNSTNQNSIKFASRIESFYHHYLIEPALIEINSKIYLFFINMSKAFKCDIEYGALNEKLEYAGNKTILECKKSDFFPNFSGIVKVNDKYIITGDNGLKSYGYATIDF